MDSVKDYRRRRRRVIGDNLRRRREQLGLTDRDVARILWMRVSDYRRYELGLHEPRDLHAIADALHTTVAALEEEGGP